MSQPPQYPSPNDPGRGGPGPGGFSPPPNYGAPPSPHSYGAPDYGDASNYGGPPGAPPPPQGYGAAPAAYGAGTSGPYSIGDAFNWAWNKFTKNTSTLIVPALIYAVVFAVIGIVLYVAFIGAVFASMAATTTTDAYGNTVQSSGGAGLSFVAMMGGGALSGFVTFFFLMYAMAGLISGCLDIADGRPVSVGSFLKPRNLGPVLVTALLVAVLYTIGALMCLIPGLIVLFFAQFAIAFVVDRSLSPVEALKASIAVARANVGNALLAMLVVYGITMVGSWLCYVGLLAAWPLAVLVQTYTYRRLSGGQVVALTP